MTLRGLLWRVLKPPVYLIVALVVLFEEWMWEPLQALAKLIGSLPVLRRLEAWVAALPPRGALAMFLTPTLIILPFKIAAVAAFAHGMFATGLIVAISAKLVGTALVARIFTLCRGTLLGIPWFARAHAWVSEVRDKALAWIHRTPVYRGVKAFTGAIRRRFFSGRPGFLGKLWRFVRRRVGE